MHTLKVNTFVGLLSLRGDKGMKDSINIAKKALDACFTEFGIVAGVHHFIDLWARDSLFATFGATSDAAKRTIETFLKYQRSDGLIPYLILRSHHNIGKYFGRQTYYKTPVSQFRSHISFGIVLDGGTLIIIAIKNYVETTGDLVFLKKYYVAMTHAFSWYEKKFGTQLISEWFSCEWADATLKIGKTLYTNVLYYKAAQDLFWIATKLKKIQDAKRYAQIAIRIGDQIRFQFWTGTHFADWIDYKRHDYLATHPNMLAIIFGLTTKKEAVSILMHAKNTAWNGWTLRNTDVLYPWWRISPFHLMIRMSDYHNGMIWLQPGILYAIALKKVGKLKEAKRILECISVQIMKHNGVYEVYEKNGKPVRRFFYKSEHPFAWSAGLFLFAHDQIIEKSRGNSAGNRITHKPA